MGRLNHHDDVEPLLLTGLDQQRNVFDHDASLTGGFTQLCRRRSYPGVDDGVQLSAGVVVIEHLLPQCRAVQGSLLSDDVLAELGVDFGQSLGTGCHDLTGQFVRVDHDRAVLSHTLRDDRFP